MCDHCNVLRDAQSVVSASASVPFVERRDVVQALQPGAVVLLAAAGWTAAYLCLIMCCAEKCIGT